MNETGAAELVAEILSNDDRIVAVGVTVGYVVFSTASGDTFGLEVEPG